MEAAEVHAAELKRTYDAVARLVGCGSDEIALVENATRGWDMAFYSLRFKPGDRILTSRSEYGSNYIAYLQVAQRIGAVVEVLPSDEHGQVSSVHYFNTEQELQQLVDAVQQLTR